MRGAQHGRVPDDMSSSRAGALRPLRGARRGAARLKPFPARDPTVLVCVSYKRMASVVDAMPAVDHARTGAARRRRERRLRAYLRYARMSVAMALAEATHHTAPRGQRNARAREEECEVHNTAAFRTTCPPPEPELFDLFEEPGGGRPDLLLEPQGQQLGVPRHFVEHLAEFAPMVQILDAPVP